MVPKKIHKSRLNSFKELINKDKQMLSLFLYIGIILFGTFAYNLTSQASTTEIKVNYIVTDEPLAANASVCDTNLEDEEVRCTLRAAIQLANARAAEDTNTYKIVFSEITGDDNVISVTSSLPAITKKVEIDGTDLEGDVRDITIEGGAQAGVDGFLFDGPDAHGSKLENLVIRGFANYNLKINGSTRTDGASTYLIQNNYFGVDQDGSTVHTTTNNANINLLNSNHITLSNNVVSSKRTYQFQAYKTSYIQIQNSKIGTTASGAKLVNGSTAITSYQTLYFYGANTSEITIDNNLIGGNSNGFSIRLDDTDNYTISNNQICINDSSANLCDESYGIYITGVNSSNYSTGGSISGNHIDGPDAISGGKGIIKAVILDKVDDLTFSNNQIATVNGLKDFGGYLLQITNVRNSIFEKGDSGKFGTAASGIYFAGGDIYNNTFKDFEIEWVGGTPSGVMHNNYAFDWSNTSVYKNTFSNLKISGWDQVMRNLSSGSHEFNYFDGVAISNITSHQFASTTPFTTAQNGLQSGTPTVNSTSYSNGDFIVNIDVSATVTGESCTFIAYISDVDGEADTYLVDSQGNRQIAGTLESGTCTLSKQDLIIPETYTIQNTNYIVTAVTDVIASATLSDGVTAVSDVKETSSYSSSATATFDLPLTANITVDDGDADDTEAMFPKNTTITLDASTSVNGGSYKWDLNNEVDSDGDGTPDNDTDATGTAVEVNYISNQVNGASFATDISGDLQFNITLTATGVMGDTQSVTKELTLLDPIIGDFTTCAADPGGGYQIPLVDDSTITPASLYWDFDTLTDAESDGDDLTTWDADTILDNDQQSVFPMQLIGPSYDTGTYTLSLNHLDTAGQIATATVDIEVVDSISAPVPSFTYTVVDGLQVSFAGSATGNCITGWSWDFDNDGTEDSTEQNPTHTFAGTGTYKVKLTATNSAGSVQSDGIEISVTDTPPTANFTANTTNINQGESVEFTDTSTGLLISSYSWDLNTAIDSDGDGITSNDSDSTDQNPTLTYTNVAGVVTTKLTVTNPAGSDTHTIDINVTPKAEFTLDDGSGNAALEFDGTEDPVLPNQDLIVPQSQAITLNVANPVGGVIYTWDLNTAIHSDGDLNPANDADAAGQAVSVNYLTGAVNGAVNNNLLGNSGDIILSLTASSGGLESTQSATIRVFSATGGVSATCLAKKTQLTFTNSSTGFESSSYDFGDGTVVNHLENTTTSQTHSYDSAGEYTAVLSVFDNATVDGQSDTNSHTITVEESIDSPSASATYTKFVPESGDDFHAQFTNTSTGGCLGYEWDFDKDGATDSTDKNPTYDFGALGTYQVSLTVVNNQGTDTVTFDVVITDAGPTAGFTASTTNSQADQDGALTVEFTNTTTGDGFTSQWDFETDGTIDSYINNTQKKFTSPGVYTVTLTVENYEGTSTTTQDITVTPHSNFEVDRTTGNTNTTFTFTPKFRDAENYTYTWDLDNNGTTEGTDMIFSGKYNSTGQKSPKLTVASIANPALSSFIVLDEHIQVTSSGGGSNNNSSASNNNSSTNSSSDSGDSTSSDSTSESDSGESLTDSNPDSSSESSSDENQSEDNSTQDTPPENEPASEPDLDQLLESVVVEPVVITITEPTLETPAPVAPFEETPEPETDEPAEETPEEQTQAPTEEALTDESEESEEITEEQTEEEGLFDNLAGLLTGALIAEQPSEQTLAENEPELPAIQVQTEVVKVEDKQVEQELTQVFATKSEEVLTNQEKQIQVLAQADVSEKKKSIASKVVVDTAKQKEIVEKIVEKVRLKKAQEQEDVKTIQAQDEDNNGVSDAIQELIGLSNQEVEEQKQEDPNLLAPRAIFLNPNNATADIMLEMRESETYPDDKFIANGIVDAPQAQAGDIVEFYAQKDGEKLLIGASQLDENKNFSYVNRSELEPGQYDIVAKLQSENATQTEFSVPVEVTIDPQAEQIPITLDGFSGQTAGLLQSSKNTAFANTHDVISGVVLQPGQPVSLALNVDSELARVVVNFNSVLYSATAITSSTNSQIAVDAPVELAFEPGTSHTATAFAESIEDPTIKSKPVIIEFTIAQETKWYKQPFVLSALLLLVIGVGFVRFQDPKKQIV